MAKQTVGEQLRQMLGLLTDWNGALGVILYSGGGRGEEGRSDSTLENKNRHLCSCVCSFYRDSPHSKLSLMCAVAMTPAGEPDKEIFPSIPNGQNWIWKENRKVSHEGGGLKKRQDWQKVKELIFLWEDD